MSLVSVNFLVNATEKKKTNVDVVLYYFRTNPENVLQFVPPYG